jgi:diketogulonate reductase-like aldo/keto reductase
MQTDQPAPKENLAPAATDLKSCARLNNGVLMPWLGLGVWRTGDDAETENAVRAALEHGYRSIDTATIYENERGVGRALRASGVPRQEVFITTKLWNDDVRAGRAEAAFEESLRRLGLDYIDLYLVHWPVAGAIGRAWRAMEKIHRSGRARAIGVCNHLIPHLDELLGGAEIFPAVNQIELHPCLQNRPLQEYCRGKAIQVEAWSPLMQGGGVLHDPVIAEIARVHGKTTAQVILRWQVQAGLVTIPKTTRPERMRENAGIFDFVLTEAQMTAIDARDRGVRVGPDPMNFNF